jgi:hypothetical protein
MGERMQARLNANRTRNLPALMVAPSEGWTHAG